MATIHETRRVTLDHFGKNYPVPTHVPATKYDASWFRIASAATWIARSSASRRARWPANRCCEPGDIIIDTRYRGVNDDRLAGRKLGQLVGGDDDLDLSIGAAGGGVDVSCVLRAGDTDLEHVDGRRRAAAVMQVELQGIVDADGHPLGSAFPWGRKPAEYRRRRICPAGLGFHNGGLSKRVERAFSIAITACAAKFCNRLGLHAASVRCWVLFRRSLSNRRVRLPNTLVPTSHPRSALVAWCLLPAKGWCGDLDEPLWHAPLHTRAAHCAWP